MAPDPTQIRRSKDMADPMRIRAQAAGDKATVRVLMSHE
ncbi:MAG: thiosulfate oxidation carrier complex protein SoxZ, partial [Rhodoferax sp.]|nr:thiosulfate oxidation carrier complex protein SoxZ [Rhodoferax sp.]